jgi:hypothetical protein
MMSELSLCRECQGDTKLLFDVLQAWRECDRNEPGMKAAGETI